MKKQLPTDSIANELTGSSVFFANGKPVAVPQPHTVDPALDTDHDSRPGSNHAPTVAGNHATVPPQPQDEPSFGQEAGDLEAIRQVVKQVGKEAATYRLTREEKQQLGELVYRYGQQGYRTSENEITRIAINWLLRDQRSRGPQSVLAQLLDALHR